MTEIKVCVDCNTLELPTVFALSNRLLKYFANIMFFRLGLKA